MSGECGYSVGWRLVDSFTAWAGTGHWSLGSCSRGGGGKYRQIRDSSLIAGNTSLPIVNSSYKDLMNISSIAWVGVGVKVCPYPVLSMLITSSLLSSRAPDRAVTEAGSNVHSITVYLQPSFRSMALRCQDQSRRQERGSGCHRRPFMQLVWVT